MYTRGSGGMSPEILRYFHVPRQFLVGSQNGGGGGGGGGRHLPFVCL